MRPKLFPTSHNRGARRESKSHHPFFRSLLGQLLATWRHPWHPTHAMLQPSRDDLTPMIDENNSGFPQANVAAIEDYGLIGDCRAAALLDRDRGGHWSITPVVLDRIERQYLPDSNVLQTRFSSSTGTAVLTDLMPVASERFRQPMLLPDHEIIRRVECTSGEVQIDIAFVPRSEYGLKPVQIREAGELGLRMEVGRGVYWLRAGVPLRLRDGGADARVTMRAGDTLLFSLSY